MSTIIRFLICLVLVIGLQCQDKSILIIENLIQRFPISSIYETMKTNTILPLNIVPEFDGKAKKLYENIIYIEIHLENLKKAGSSETLIIQTENLLKKMKDEFEALKIPFMVDTLKKVLLDFLHKVKHDNYLDMVLLYQKEADSSLVLTVDLIMNAIVNGSN